MERRKAIGLLALAAAGLTVFPACEFTRVPHLDNFQVEKETFKNLKKLCAKVLPIPEETILEQMGPAEFVLIMMDDCNKKEDIDLFKTGMDQFFLANEKMDELSDEELAVMLEENEFLQKVKGLNIWYYQGLESYLNNYTDYEFVPGRFIGCVNV